MVVFYLVFLLLEVRQLPARVRAGFRTEQADHLFQVVGSINRAMSSYLRAKVLSSLVTALPVVAILWAFGVPFAGMWGVLTFIGNFVPYVGSLVAFVLPVVLAFLELEPAWRPISVLVLLVLVQFVTNNFVEPRLTARACRPQPARRAGRPGVLGPVLGCDRDGAGRAPDGDAEDRARERRVSPDPWPG